MNRTMQVSDSVLIDADAETIWQQVADPTQMSRWSPENTGATAPVAGRPLQVGEGFDGTNRRGRARWITHCVVTESDPGRRFAFELAGRRLRSRRYRWHVVRRVPAAQHPPHARRDEG